MDNRFIAVCGPTASGKSTASVALAEQLNAEILCFDASQAFLSADIGTAKISEVEKSKVTHHLLDLIKPSERLEAGFFVDHAKEKFDELKSQNILPLICVGSSMYLSLFLDGIAETGSGDLELREKLERLDTQALYEQLQKIDPLRSEALHPNDRLRVIRALEISSVTGKTASQLYSEQQKEREISYCGLYFIICWEREELSSRIATRVNSMLSSGLVSECRDLVASFGRGAQIFDSIGYAETLKFLEGQITEQQLKDEIVLHSKQLAKKQLSFLRRLPQKYGWECLPTVPYTEVKAAGLRKGELRFDFKPIKLAVSDLARLSREFLTEDPKSAKSRVVYIDGPSLLETLAVR